MRSLSLGSRVLGGMSSVPHYLVGGLLQSPNSTGLSPLLESKGHLVEEHGLRPLTEEWKLHTSISVRNGSSTWQDFTH